MTKIKLFLSILLWCFSCSVFAENNRLSIQQSAGIGRFVGDGEHSNRSYTSLRTGANIFGRLDIGVTQLDLYDGGCDGKGLYMMWHNPTSFKNIHYYFGGEILLPKFAPGCGGNPIPLPIPTLGFTYSKQWKHIQLQVYQSTNVIGMLELGLSLRAGF